MLNVKEVAERLGVHKQMIERYQRNGKLVPDFQLRNGDRIYTEESVERFQKLYQSRLMTLKEIGDVFGVSRDVVLYHFRKKRHIQPDAHRGNFVTFGDAKVMMIARSQEWVKNVEETVVGNAIVGTMFLPKKGKWCAFVRRGGRIYTAETENKELATKVAEMETAKLRSPLLR